MLSKRGLGPSLTGFMFAFVRLVLPMTIKPNQYIIESLLKVFEYLCLKVRDSIDTVDRDLHFHSHDFR